MANPCAEPSFTPGVAFVSAFRIPPSKSTRSSFCFEIYARTRSIASERYSCRARIFSKMSEGEAHGLVHLIQSFASHSSFDEADRLLSGKKHMISGISKLSNTSSNLKASSLHHHEDYPLFGRQQTLADSEQAFERIVRRWVEPDDSSKLLMCRQYLRAASFPFCPFQHLIEPGKPFLSVYIVDNVKARVIVVSRGIGGDKFPTHFR